MITYKGYTGVFEYDPDIGAFAGRVVDTRDRIYFEGRSVEELNDSLSSAVDDYLEACGKLGDEPDKPFSGKILVRMEPHLHRSAIVAAAAEGVSLNSWIVQTVQDRTTARD